jgi:hypothetical protein
MAKSYIDHLRKRKGFSKEFETQLSILSIEEIIAAKLAISSKPLRNNKQVPFYILQNLDRMVLDGIYRYVKFYDLSNIEVSELLGIDVEIINKYKGEQDEDK